MTNKAWWRFFRALLLVPVLAAGQAEAFKNEPTGFRGIKWGTEYRSVADQFDRQVAPDMYRRKNDKLAMGEAALESLRYSFYKGQFAAVLMQARLKENGRPLMDALRAEYGEGRQPDRSALEYFWNGEAATIVLDCDAARDLCNLAIYSTAIMRQREADAKRGK
jgi:hypothetical protein